ncbi:MAG: chemotaxis-specific protein-glutamate methyltransferase CheB [Pseudomonadota bacterium]
MLVDDSGVSRALISRWLSNAGIKVCAQARNGEEALALLASARPALVLLDLEMPRMTGSEVLPRLLERLPGVPIVMVSTLTQRGARVTIDALRVGAADAIAKPRAGWAGDTVETFRQELVQKVSCLLASPVEDRVAEPHRLANITAMAGFRPDLIVIGASTGGPSALFDLVPRFPSAPRIPIVIVQHMPPLFTRILAEQLTRIGPIPADEAVDGAPFAPGRIHVAPGNRHLEIARSKDGRYAARLTDAPPEQFCRPAVDVTLRTLASACGSKACAVILTGMGTDGRDGAGAVKAAGGRVIVQNRESATIWGMPGAVSKAGHADAVLPLAGIGTAISDMTAADIGMPR